MKTAGIVGVGLIGGSLAKCLKQRCGFETVIGFDLDENTLKCALEDGALDIAAADAGASFADCDIVFICTPVDVIADYARMLAPHLKPTAILTDAGSTKKNVMEQMEGLGTINFIGGHPMAGSEKMGYDASKAYLFENACYVLCGGASTDELSMKLLAGLVEQLGAIPFIMDAAAHDRVVSCISHAPHIVAASLVNAVRKMDAGDGGMRAMAAGGFKDITRIASSSPWLWNAIAMDNRREILAALAVFKEELAAFERELASDGDATPLFSASKNYRDSFQSSAGHSYGKDYTIMVDVEDKPGIIATVSTMLSVNNINIKNIGVLNNREYEDGIMQIVFDRRESKEKSVELLKGMNFTVFDD